MTISRRIFLYSLGVVSLVAVLILAYFTLMLSALYAKQIEVDRLDALKQVQNVQLSEGSQKMGEVLGQFDMPTSIFSLSLPKNEQVITVDSVYNSFDVTLKDPELIVIYQDLLTLMETIEERPEKEVKKMFTQLVDRLKKVVQQKGLEQKWDDFAIGLDIKSKDAVSKQIMKVDTPPKFHRINDQQFIIESQVADKASFYTSYIGMVKRKNHYYLVLATSMTPKMTALQKVIYHSLPTIMAVILVVVILATLLFSKILITPVKRIARKMEQMKSGEYQNDSVEITRQSLDEYQQLEQNLATLYQQLAKQQQQLVEQNQKQKIFLSASSHQLKTPVTAALLLIEGMMAEIGKYKETQKYLPEVKSKMMTMKGMINDILLIDQQVKEEPVYQQVDLTLLIAQFIQQQQVVIVEKNIQIDNQLSVSTFIQSDPLYLEKILDNLLSNALNYTPSGGNVIIRGNSKQLIIENTGVMIAEEYLEQIFEPFIRPTQSASGHGLGLYIVAQYAQILEITVQIDNDLTNNSVVSTIIF